MTNPYGANPVCMPARASIFTGRYPSRHRVWNNGVHLPLDERLISHRLFAAGYRTHYIGKAHFQPFEVSPEQSIEARKGDNPRYPEFRGPYYGFETVDLALGHATYGLRGHYGEWVRSQVSTEEFVSYQQATRLSQTRFGGEAFDWTIPLKYHNSVWTADRTIDFLTQHDGEKPFLLSVGFQDPHHPHCLPLEFRDRVDPNRVPLPAYTEGELDDKPPHFLEARCGQLGQSAIRGRFPIIGGGNGIDFRKVTEEEARLGRAYYYSLVKLIDQQIGRILECLDRTGLAENTLVVFTSDHGELLGDYGLWMKGPFHYEPLIRIPLLLRWPQGLAGGRRILALFSHVDLVPTLLAAAGLECPQEVDGRNALSLLRGETTCLRDAVMVECVDDPHGLRLKTIVTMDRKLTWYCGQDYGELYDLEKDPGEVRNHWEDAAYMRDRALLLERLLDKMDSLEQRPTRLCNA